MKKEMNINVFLLFKPFLFKKINCAVTEAYHLLRPELEVKNIKHTYVNNWYPDFNSVLKSKSFDTEDFKKLFVFIHGDEGMSSFYSFLGLSCKNWWDPKSKDKYKLVLFHSCYGSKILNENNWNKLFEGWVSYSDKTLFTLCTTIIAERWKSLFIKMTLLVLESNNSQELYDNLKSLFKMEAQELKKLPRGSGKTYMISHIAHMNSVLKHS